MKLTNLIMPLLALTTVNNPIQVKADCIQDCVDIHTAAAKACCAVAPYNPIVFAACMGLAGSSFT